MYTWQVFLRMRARTSPRASVNTSSLFMCEHSVWARSAGPGPRFNIKMTSYQYRKSHWGDKTVVRSSYLHNGISYTGKMSSLYWIGALQCRLARPRQCECTLNVSFSSQNLQVIRVTSLLSPSKNSCPQTDVTRMRTSGLLTTGSHCGDSSHFSNIDV